MWSSFLQGTRDLSEVTNDETLKRLFLHAAKYHSYDYLSYEWSIDLWPRLTDLLDLLAAKGFSLNLLEQDDLEDLGATINREFFLRVLGHPNRKAYPIRSWMYTCSLRQRDDAFERLVEQYGLPVWRAGEVLPCFWPRHDFPRRLSQLVWALSAEDILRIGETCCETWSLILRMGVDPLVKLPTGQTVLSVLVDQAHLAPFLAVKELLNLGKIKGDRKKIARIIQEAEENRKFLC